MPPPPNYDCPVCKKGFQRGYLAKHIHTHSQSDLKKEVINRDDIMTKSAHPHFNCSGHTYIICPFMKSEGFELGTKLHREHTCNYTYADWLNDKSTEPVAVSVPKKKNTIVEPKEEPIVNQINMILPEDEKHSENHIKCNCHIEIARLKIELERFNTWKELILSSVPKALEPKVSELKALEPKVSEPKVSEPKASESGPNIIVPPRKATKPKIQASKKEIEKGMWCTTCEACGTTAQFNTDLRACCSCKRMTHFNDDLTNCYHWDCTVCDKKSCYSCVKQAGGNKMKPLCSQTCANIYKLRK